MKDKDTAMTSTAIPSQKGESERMRFALEQAAEQFAFYGREHREKAQVSRGNGLTLQAEAADAKALTNEAFADLCRIALSPIDGAESDPTKVRHSPSSSEDVRREALEEAAAEADALAHYFPAAATVALRIRALSQKE